MACRPAFDLKRAALRQRSGEPISETTGDRDARDRFLFGATVELFEQYSSGRDGR